MDLAVSYDEIGSDADGASRTFVVAAHDAERDATFEVIAAGKVGRGASGPLGLLDPAPIYLVRISLPWRTQGRKSADTEITAEHVLERVAGEWCLRRTNFFSDGAEITPSARARRSLGIEARENRAALAVMFERVVAVQSGSDAGYGPPKPHQQAQRFEEIAMQGWGIALPHVNRGRRPSVDPDGTSQAARTRAARIAARSTRPA